MTNNEIIINQAIAHGIYTKAEAQAIVAAKQEAFTMAATERKIPGTFAPVPGGYSQQIGANTALFIPDFSVSRYDPSTGEVYGYAPDYDALEAAKTPAVQATAPGEYSYCYEMQQAPTGCDYAADLAYYGKQHAMQVITSPQFLHLLPSSRGHMMINASASSSICHGGQAPLPPCTYGRHQHRVWLGGRGGHYRQSKRYHGSQDLHRESGRQPVAHCCAAAWQRCPLQGDQDPERVEK